MSLALARALDARAIALTSALVGRSRRLDRAATILAVHLAKLHIALLGLMLLGGRGPAGWRRREAAIRTAAALPVTILVVAAIGRLCERQRPFAGPGITPSLVEHAPGRSFPSRHSACAVTMTVVTLPASPIIGGLMGLGALGLALSRVYTGLHYPSDVLGGWLIGLAVGMIARQKKPARVPWS